MATRVTELSKERQTRRSKGKPNLEAAKAELEANEEARPPAALLLDASDERLTLRSLPVTSIVAGANPRQETDPDKQRELTASIREHGVLQPIRVRPLEDGSFQLISGWRRWSAAKTAKLDEIPVVVASAKDQDAYVQSLVENLQREDLNSIDEARALKAVLDTPGADGKKMTQVQLAKTIAKSQPYISNKLGLLTLPEEIIAKVESGAMPEGTAKAIRTLPPAAQKRVATEASKRNMTVPQVEREAAYERTREAKAQADKSKEKEVAAAWVRAVLEGRQSKALAKNAVLLVYSERWAKYLTDKGYPAQVFDSKLHTLKNGKIDCNDRGVLVEVMEYQSGMPAKYAKVCTNREHVEKVIREEREKSEAEALTQITSVNEARELMLKVLIDESGDAPTELGLRYALYTLYSTSGFRSTASAMYDAGNGDLLLADFRKRQGIPDQGSEFPRMWGIWPAIVDMPIKSVVFELIAHGIREFLPNVYGDTMRNHNARHVQLRQWFIQNHGLDESIAWGGHEPIDLRRPEQKIDAALTPHEFKQDAAWRSEAIAEWVQLYDGPDKDTLSAEELTALWEKEYLDEELCATCMAGGEETTRADHDAVMALLEEVEAGTKPDSDETFDPAEGSPDPVPDPAPGEEADSAVAEEEATLPA